MSTLFMLIPKVLPRRYAAPLLVALTATLSAAGCVGDVTVPTCFLDDTCADAGANDGGTPGSGETGGTTQAGASVSGGEAFGGTTQTQPNAGAGGSGDTDAVGGMGGAVVETDCGDCIIAPAQLRAACAGSSYEATLAISGGEPPYRWQITPALPDSSITVDPEHPEGALLKVAKMGDENIELTVKVTDGKGRQQSSTFPLTVRKSCFFAFTALGEQGSELRVLDPFALDPAPLVLKHNSGVYDFKFSPDGRHLAYRFGASEAAPQGAHLALVDLATLDDEVLSFAEDRVQAFSWSPDSSTLAVAFGAGSNTYLTALPLSAPLGGKALNALTPTPASVGSDLYWVGNDFVAYHAALIPDFAHPGQFLSGEDNPFDLHTAFYSELDDNGFGQEVWTPDSFPPDVMLQPTNAGFFMITEGDPGTVFTSLTGDEQVGFHIFTSLVSPSGKYSALLDDNSLLQLLTAEGGIDAAPVATAKAGEACPMPLAWAKGAERIACLADVPNAGSETTHGEVRIFDFDEKTDTLAMSTVGGFCKDNVSLVNAASCTTLLQGYGYGTSQASGAARAFSPSGRRFAFASVFEGRTMLYAADLGDRPGVLKTKNAFFDVEPIRQPTRLVFSPDERLLLLHSGSRLMLHNLDTAIVSSALSVDLSRDEKCSDDFSADPASYCGSAEPADGLRWSPDSRAFAFRTPGAITLVGTTEPLLPQRPFQAPECDEECANQFEFQPQPSP